MRVRATAFAMVSIIMLSVFALTGYLMYAQPSEEEARATFESIGCVSCHNGTVAATWDEIVNELKEVPEKYGGDIDAFARDVAYFGQKGAFNTWDDLMATMAQNVGKQPSDPDIQKINEFFLSIAGVSGGETTQTETAQETTTPQATTGETETVETQTEKAEAGIPFGLAAAIALLIVVLIAAAAYMFARR
ncbi:hypothetical protein [Aeropyrum camini]|uniref:Cytochrome c domain-containing protein n=1 Tax=Aeropyrum camini SY1 = JCM 12091 TaxID=1198449 RepID=U3TET6_9CREN|nr:hypothetical protein [Aeropyrum camini]BAN90545.1 hypothetical protein ACAM_1076 [Aeropyrum camini SY1 = JCM 12091]